MCAFSFKDPHNDLRVVGSIVQIVLVCTWSMGSSDLPRYRPRAKDMTTVCIKASSRFHAGAALSCFLSLLVLKSSSPSASAVFAQLLAQKDRRS